MENTTLAGHLEEVSQLASDLPSVPIHKTSIFSILQLEHKELPYSRMLAYYFDPGEEHGFGPLFLRALHDCVGRSFIVSNGLENFFSFSDDAETEYHIEREYYTNDNLYIDLLLSDSKPDKNRQYGNVVIVENKIWAELYNQLDKYFNSVSSSTGNKILIVLSVHNYQKEIDAKFPQYDGKFIAVSYKSLASNVRSLLPDYFTTADAAQLVLLQHFLLSIDSKYPNPKMDQNLIQTVSLYQQHYQAFVEANKRHEELVMEISSLIDDYYSKLRIPHRTTSSKKSENRHYWPRNASDKIIAGYRFYAYVPWILRDKAFLIKLELENKQITTYRDEIRSRIIDILKSKAIEINEEPLMFEDNIGNPGSSWCRLFAFKIDVDQQIDLKVQLHNLFSKFESLQIIETLQEVLLQLKKEGKIDFPLDYYSIATGAS